ncbi:RHS repeat domain-containing protein [Pseudomonas fluorescens]|uniref:RHS repeat domain-containing protein n=1 Tax=Pseudomonas fluorescens TaxID=294 RepID=UPI0009B9E6B6|nr:RHS repeat-associated core domain-containing protein [Pseudomonas fluorescens]
MPTGIFTNAHTGTPTLRVSEARGLVVRDVQFHRREVDDPIDTRVTEQRFDAVGRLVASRDPYLFDLAKTDETTPFNLRQTMSLSGVALATDSVDAGWRVGLQGEAGQSLERWDGRGSHSLTQYDELLRPTAIRERGQDVAEHTLERFTYADASAEAAAHNLCGLLIRHDDPAGTVRVHDQSLAGGVLSHTRHFLRDTEAPDWPLEVAEREALLESGDGATTLNAYSANSEPWSQTDALGNRQAFTYTIDGQLKNTRLTLAGDSQTEKLLVSDLRYNATGQLETETAGNGVITRRHYDEANGRLTQLSAHKADGTPLQDLNYLYDPVGNVLSIEDAAQPIRYFNNQRIEPIKAYQYDTLNQLIYATGCEAHTGRGGPALPDLQPLPPDPSQIANYTQTYHYDAGGNLLDLVHVGAQAHGRTLTRSRYSNRCLPQRDNRPPTEDELANGFDANGNLRELQAGQSLTWDLRNQLREVRPVLREDAKDDCECYVYDGGGQRVRKVHSSRMVIREARYLPGLEIRSHSGTGETLHVITASAGSNSVQGLHWAARQPQEIAQDQLRYNLGDHLKSSTLELDQDADLISQEWYYPFGGTAYWAGRNATEVKYKSVRYCGKECDATGLYYYGCRYYAPWLQRWINPDPAGCVDGMNLFSLVGNSPIVFFDESGHIRDDFNPPQYLQNFKFLLYEAPDPPIMSFQEARRVIHQIETRLFNFESLSSAEQRAEFKQHVIDLHEQLNTLPPAFMQDRWGAHFLERYHFLLSAASKFEPLDHTPRPKYIYTERDGKTDSRGQTYRNEGPASPGESRRPDYGTASSGFGRSGTVNTAQHVPLDPLPSGTSSRISNGYELSINIINNQNINTLFPDAESALERYKRIAVLIHPDKLFHERRPDVRQRATQAFQILGHWRDLQNGPPQSNSPPHRTQPHH